MITYLHGQLAENPPAAAVLAIALCHAQSCRGAQLNPPRQI
jgi:hypothetical protein